MAQTCRNCQTYIAQGRTFCDAHYQEALADYEIDYENYQAALQQYYADVESWNAMSVEEQNAYHEHAEEEALSGIAIFAGAIVGGGFWFINSDEIPWWLGALATIFAIIVFYVGRNLFSKLLRGLGYGIGWGALFIGLGWAAQWILQYFDPSIVFMVTAGKADAVIHAGLAALGLLVGQWREFTGDHHAYGGPVEPIAPSRPSP
jgi:cation transport ATPase